MKDIFRGCNKSKKLLYSFSVSHYGMVKVSYTKNQELSKIRRMEHRALSRIIKGSSFVYKKIYLNLQIKFLKKHVFFSTIKLS